MARRCTFRSAIVMLYRAPAGASSPCDSPRLRIETVDDARVDDALAMDGPARVEQFRRFLAAGERGYYAYAGDCVAHRSWVRIGPADVSTWHDHARLGLRDGQAYVHYCETAPGMRGQGVFPAVLRTIRQDLGRAGLRDVYIATTADNRASQRGIEKAGFVEVQRTRVRVRFGIARESRLAASRG